MGHAVDAVRVKLRALSGVNCFALVLMIFAGCATIPQKELAAYTIAISATRTAGEQMVEDWQAARAELERREQAKKPSPQPTAPDPIPLRYSPSTNGATKMSAEKVRLLAWETIGDYTAILASLNAGESVESVKSSAGRLYNLAVNVAEVSGSSIPGGDAIVNIFKELAAQLEKARLAEEFKKALKGGAPKVRGMLLVFRADTSDHYLLRASLAAADYERVDRETGLLDTERRLKKARIKASNDEFRKSLDNYVRLIDQTYNTLVALETAEDRPIDFVGEANRMLDIALDLKQHWVAYQNARSEGNL